MRFQPTEAGRDPLEASLKAEVNLLVAEQSNSLLTIGDVAMLKMLPSHFCRTAPRDRNKSLPDLSGQPLRRRLIQ